jgi:hypothetical protein
MHTIMTALATSLRQNRQRQQWEIFCSTLLAPAGSILGMMGAVWMAFRIPGFHYAYVPFVLSSGALSLYLYRKGETWCMYQQLVFTVINAVGIYRWIVTA